MVTVPTIRTKTILKELVEAVNDFAKARNWRPGDYSMFVRVQEDWLNINFILVVPDLGGQTPEAVWNELDDHLEEIRKELAETGFYIGYLVRDRKQVEHGGIDSVPRSHVDIEDLLPNLKLTY